MSAQRHDRALDRITFRRRYAALRPAGAADQRGRLDVMNTARAYLTIVGVVVFSASVAAEPTQYIYVGDIPAACPISVKRSAAQLPASFRVTPEEAVRRASAEAHVRCNSIFEQLVYADSENYYIVKSLSGPMDDKVEAVLVNAATGKVSTRR